ncbi:MAG: hypothetical protein IEMM0008_1837 [bacterium]|nr:MAG: hypothetical protein IEMM0008_1837 [bacterium]
MGEKKKFSDLSTTSKVIRIVLAVAGVIVLIGILMNKFS